MLLSPPSMATKKITARRAVPSKRTTVRKKITAPKAVKKTSSVKTRRSRARKTIAHPTHVARVHAHGRTSHYKRRMHFSIAPIYRPIRGFSFLEGTLALMIAAFSFVVILSNTTANVNAEIEYAAETITVHHERHSPLYTYFQTNKQIEVFTQG